MEVIGPKPLDRPLKSSKQLQHPHFLKLREQEGQFRTRFRPYSATLFAVQQPSIAGIEALSTISL
jgi:hypothetical protein